MRALPLLVMLLSGPALAQVLSGAGSSGNGSASVSGYTLTANAPAPDVAVRVNTGAQLCMDGYTGVACVLYDVLAGVLRSAKPLEAPTYTVTGSGNTVILPTNAKICLDGSGCTRSIQYSSATGEFMLSGIVRGTLVRSDSSMEVNNGVLTIKATSSNGTCSSSLERAFRAFPSTGGTGTSTRTAICLCISNGSGSYFWRNISAGTDGTSTSC